MEYLGKLGAQDDNIVAYQTLAVTMRTPVSPSIIPHSYALQQSRNFNTDSPTPCSVSDI